MTTVDPLIVSNNFLELGQRENIDITPMKLQKLLYFLYREFLKSTKEALFSDRFEAWKYGPVLSEVYYEFSHYRDKKISKFYQNSDGKYLKFNEDANEQFAIALHKVWNKYKYNSGIELSKITHRSGTAWRKAWENNMKFLDDKDIMAEEAE